MKKGIILSTIVGAALLTAAPFSLQWSQKTVTLSLDSADARIGRPLTPLSVAGVHRRAYRRAAYGTAAAVGAYGVGSYYAASRNPGYSYSSYSYPASSGYGSYSSGYPSYGYGSYASGYPGFGSGFGFGSGYGYQSLYASGYPSAGYGYGSYASGYPGYGYGGLGYRAARRVAIHNARWH